MAERYMPKPGRRGPYKKERFAMSGVKTCRLVGYNDETKEQIFDWPTYALTHPIMPARL